mmetsp:Transcript_1040/g.1512  ORF Transcript_1040/g.1512 Transcript_1040/m.1512 type:complete len:724 (+) Transcript_1040:2045-4216(+)
MVRVGLPNIFKLSQGLVVTFASFVIIVQNKDTIGLLKDFTSLMVVSEFDNIIFHLASNGYLGEELHLQAAKITDEDLIITIRTSERRRKGGFIFVRFTFLAVLSAMFVGWGIIFRMQSKGTIFDTQFPGYGKEHYELAFKVFDDGKCYRGPFNTIECKYESGDCTNFNTAYPSCNGKDLKYLHDVEREVGNNKCNITFALPQCEYDGGDCCPYDIQMSPSFGDGKCDGRMHNTAGCLYDYKDCKAFNDLYRNCPNEALVGTTNVRLGNGICEGGGYDIEECGYEFGDCDQAQIGQDILLYGVQSTSSEIIDFNMLMSSDGSSILVDTHRTDKFGDYDKASNGTITKYFYNSVTLKWEHGGTIEKIEKKMDRDEYIGIGTTMNGDGSVIAFGSPRNGDLDGRVLIYNFPDTVPTQIMTSEIAGTAFGYRLDLTDDGLRIAISSPTYNYDAKGLSFDYAGMIQVFGRNTDQQDAWSQVGDNIYGRRNADLIGLKYLHLNPLDGKRIFFSARYQSPPQVRTGLRAYQFDTSTQKWLEMEIDTQQLVQDTDDSKIVALAFSGDGSRFAVSYYSALNVTDSSRIEVYGSADGEWKQTGPTLLSGANGFGPSISMNVDGSLLAASTADPSCTGSIAYEIASPDVCATGNLQLYQFKTKNPPHRPYTLLPMNSQGMIVQKDKIILGFEMTLSIDGSTLAVGGYDLVRDFGFVAMVPLPIISMEYGRILQF